MREQNVISEQSVISAEETKELIERLNDPSFRASQNQTTVKDLAETLDIDPTQIAGYLQSLREEKLAKTPLVPEVVPSQSFVSPGNLQYRKLAYVMIFTALGITAILMFMLMSKPALTAPLAPTPNMVEQGSDVPAPSPEVPNK